VARIAGGACTFAVPEIFAEVLMIAFTSDPESLVRMTRGTPSSAGNSSPEPSRGWKLFQSRAASCPPGCVISPAFPSEGRPPWIELRLLPVLGLKGDSYDQRTPMLRSGHGSASLVLHVEECSTTREASREILRVDSAGHRTEQK